MTKRKITTNVLCLFSVLLLLGCNNTTNEHKTGNGPIALTNWETFTGTLPDGFTHNQTNIQDISDPNHWKPISTLKDFVNNTSDEYIRVRAKLPQYQRGNNSIYLSHMTRYFRVYFNNDFICGIGDTASFSLADSESWLHDIVNIPCYKQGDYITFFILVNNKSYDFFSRVLISSSEGIIVELFKYCIGDIFFSIVFLFTGIVFFIINLGSIKSKPFLGISLFLISIAIFVASNSPFFRFVFKFPGFFYHADYISFMSASTNGIFAIEQSIASKYKKIVKIIWQSHFVFLTGSILFINTGVLTYMNILPFFLALLIITMIICIYIMVLSARKGQYESKLLFVGMAGLMIFAFLEVYSYATSMLDGFGYQVSFLHIGTFWFVLTLIFIEGYRNKQIKRHKEALNQKEKEASKREIFYKEKFAMQLLSSQENERNRIALELHDSVGQKLLLIKNQLLSKIKHADDRRFCESLEKICDITGDTIQDIREISRNLRPQHLDQLGLKTAIETLVEFVQESTAIIIHLNIDEIDGYISHEHEISFYRIIQESLNNIVKHSHASHAYINLKRDNGYILLSVEDNGTGITQNHNGSNEGFGLIGMQQRAKMMGVELQFVNSEKGGMLISLRYKEIQKQSDEQQE